MSNPTNTFDLSCGQKIQLVELTQCLTYEGLFGGVPNEKSNARLVERALEGAVRPHREGAPYLIAPVQTSIELGEREKAQEKAHPSPFGPPSLLPRVQCVGRFESLESEEESEEMLEPRWLVVVWFQEEFALPIDAGVVEAIRKLEWDKVAHGGGGLDWL